MVVQHMKMQFWSKKSKFKNFFWGGGTVLLSLSHTRLVLLMFLFLLLLLIC